MRLCVENFGGFFICEAPLIGAIHSTCDEFNYEFAEGIYVLSGEIDSGGWAFASSLAMSKKIDHRLLNQNIRLSFNGKICSLDDIHRHTCDLSSSPTKSLVKKPHKSIYKRVQEGIQKNHLSFTPEEIREMFFIDQERFKRPIHCVGHEIYRCNAAIGFVNDKDIYCFPWFSQKMVMSQIPGIRRTCETLAELGKIVLLPISGNVAAFNDYNIINFPNNLVR